LIFFSFLGCAAVEKLGTIGLRGEANQHLYRSKELLALGDFEGALRENEEVLSLSLHKPPEDEALFNIGMIYAHPENPKGDPAKSLHFLNQVARDYPRSPWALKAMVWTGMIHENRRLNWRLNYLSNQVLHLQQERARGEEEREGHRSISESRQFLSQGKYEAASRMIQKVLTAFPRHPMEDEALFLAGLVHAHPGNPKKDYGKSNSYFKRLIKDYPQSLWTELAKTWSSMLQENERLNQNVEKLNQTIEKSKQVDIEIEEKRREKGK